jgi:hypothetical protein
MLVYKSLFKNNPINPKIVISISKTSNSHSKLNQKNTLWCNNPIIVGSKVKAQEDNKQKGVRNFNPVKEAGGVVKEPKIQKNTPHVHHRHFEEDKHFKKMAFVKKRNEHSSFEVREDKDRVSGFIYDTIFIFTCTVNAEYELIF